MLRSFFHPPTGEPPVVQEKYNMIDKSNTKHGVRIWLKAV